MAGSGYLDTPWPAEDGGPARLQVPHGVAGLALRPGERLAATAVTRMMSTMTVLGAPGEVYLLTHSALRARVGLPTSCRVSLIDPLTLQSRASSPRLPGGPMWPGGMAVHRNGDLYVVYGRFAHRLNSDCDLLASLKLPVNEAYNSFVVLDNGLIVTKNLSESTPARLSVIDPESMALKSVDTECPEPSIARLSALGNTVYVVGVRSIFRYHWNDALRRLVQDTDWRFAYLGASGNSFGWDVVLDGENAWFMDNGKHRYLYTMRGAGVRRSANRLIRVSLTDSTDHFAVNVSGLVGGCITNPPVFDVQRQIVVGYDSANAVLQAWRFDRATSALEPLWTKSDFGAASHMILYPDTGELVVNDYRRFGEEVVVLQIETGVELGRVRTGGLTQGVVFPSVGWARDFYWSSMGRVARIFVQ